MVFNLNNLYLNSSKEIIINWINLSMDDSDEVYELLKEKIDELKKDHYMLERICKNLTLTSNPKLFRLIPNDSLINWQKLNLNGSKFAVELLKKNLDKICPYNLSQNPNSEALDLLDKYYERCPYFFRISKDKFLCIETIDKTSCMISNLCKNPNSKVLDILHKYFFYKEDNTVEIKIAMDALSENKANWAMFFILDHIYLFNKYNNSLVNSMDLMYLSENIYLFCSNYYFYDYFDADPERIVPLLNLNKSDWVIDLLQKYPEKIHWGHLSLNRNPRAARMVFEKLKSISLIKPSGQDFSEHRKFNHFFKNITKENFNLILENILFNLNNEVQREVLDFYDIAHEKLNVNDLKPQINYKYNYEFLKERIGVFKEDLIAYVWNPERFEKWPENPFIDSN
jgi:hypothetical protein